VVYQIYIAKSNQDLPHCAQTKRPPKGKAFGGLPFNRLAHT
jgi:hypothetical protein